MTLVSGRGGVGKTTLGVNLAAYLAAAMPVTFIDADPRGIGARWLRDGRNVRPGLVVLYSPGPRTIREVFEMADGVTIVDSPSGNVELNRSLLERTDVVLVPTGTSRVDVKSAGAAVERLGAAGRPGLLVLTRSSLQQRAEHEKGRAALSKLAMPMAQTEIRWHSAHGHAAAQRLTVDDLSPRNHAFREIRGLAAELMSLFSSESAVPHDHPAQRGEQEEFMQCVEAP